jgi:NADH-quinone oxidoreductase subunit L
LLIGFWYLKRSANDAAIKAFVTNRVGDFGFALGIMAAFFCYHSIQYDAVFGAAETHPGLMLHLGPYAAPAVEVISLLLFIGAMGKSAQFFLHVWLPDAMEGPTPVSALIHAATMVTAGVFMVCRCGALFQLAPLAGGFVTIIGATTALFAATVGLAQNDIKRVVAYSTCSQLGYMFFAAGLGAYNAAMFHLFTHAFFKALLFLGAGSVIVGLHHEQDMRNMGGVRKHMTFTWAMMLIGTLALIGFGIPGLGGFAGFYSKDAIIETAYRAGEAGAIGGQYAFWCGVSAAFLTSFYSWRLLFMTFEGRYRGASQSAAHAPGHGEEGHPEDEQAPANDAHASDVHAQAANDAHAGSDHDHGGDHGDHHAMKPNPDGSAPAHEAPWVMLAPLAALAVGAIAAGAFFAPYFLGARAEHFWHGALALRPETETALPSWVTWAPLEVTVAGFVLAVLIYGLSSTMGRRIAEAGGPIWAFLYHKWYFDEIYDFVLVKGARAVGDLFWKVGDQRIIDGLGPDGFSAASRFVSRQLRKLQTGYVYHYSFLMLAAAVAFGAYALLVSFGGAR